MKTDEQNAKQGRTGRPVLMILVAALVLAALVAVALKIGADDTVDADIGEPGVQTETTTTQQ